MKAGKMNAERTEVRETGEVKQGKETSKRKGGKEGGEGKWEN